MDDVVIVYKDKAGEWRWRRVALNGKIVSDGAEGYSRKWNAKRAARRTNAGVVIVVAK